MEAIFCQFPANFRFSGALLMPASHHGPVSWGTNKIIAILVLKITSLSDVALMVAVPWYLLSAYHF